MTTIIQTDENTFTTDNGRGTTLTLKWNTKIKYWEVWSDNAARRAWNSLGVKVFWKLAEVEKKYKAFRGITNLIEERG